MGCTRQAIPVPVVTPVASQAYWSYVLYSFLDIHVFVLTTLLSSRRIIYRTKAVSRSQSKPSLAIDVVQKRIDTFSQLCCVSHLPSVQRSLSIDRFSSNHPIIKSDGVLSVFLSEPDFDTWKRRTTLSYEEEATTKRVDPIDEMSIPSDLEEKLA